MQACIAKILESIKSPLTKQDGSKITTAEEWAAQREKIKALLEENVYGAMPPMPDQITVLSETEEESCYGGKAKEKVYMLTADHMYPEFQFGLRIIRPNTEKKVPVLFMVLCNASRPGYVYDLAEEIVMEHGYTVAMVDRTPATVDVPGADVQHSTKDQELRHDEYWYYEIYKTRKLEYPDRDLPLDEYMRQYPHCRDYGIIATGAHCVRLAVSFVLGLGFADENCLAVTGHSRDGKVALCAGVFDERLRAVIPHGSGCGGTGLYKVPAKGMEVIDDMVRMWPSWLPGLARFRDHREDEMPIDMHFARACIAPRAIMNGEGQHDFWAGPFSSYVGMHAAQEVFDLLGVPKNNGTFIRPGFHALTREDIMATLQFCDQVFYGKKSDYDFNSVEYPVD